MILPRVAILAAAMGLLAACSGCSTTGGLNDDALRATKAALTAYADVYQPMVIHYGNLPSCDLPEHPPICRDEAVLDKLQRIDRDATQAITAANVVIQQGGGDGTELTEAVTTVNAAGSAIASAMTTPVPAE